MIDKLPGRILSCDKFSHFSIKIGNNMTHIDFNLTVILNYILLVNLRYTLLTLHMRGYAIILILFLRFGPGGGFSVNFRCYARLGKKFVTVVHFRHILTRSSGHVPVFTSVHESDCQDILKINSIFSIPCALFVHLSRLSSFTRSVPKICRFFS